MAVMQKKQIIVSKSMNLKKANSYCAVIVLSPPEFPINSQSVSFSQRVVTGYKSMLFTDENLRALIKMEL